MGSFVPSEALCYVAAVLWLPPLLRLLLSWALALRSSGKSVEPEHVEAWADDAYQDPRCAALLQDKGGGHLLNTRQVETIESDLCTGKLLCMHRPTHEPWRDEAGQYPFAWHLAGRQRLWELRVQLQFKKKPTGAMYLALTYAKYLVKTRFVQAIDRSVCKALMSVVGLFYASRGDNPADVPSGEPELPTLAFPLWAFDQFVVSEPGEEPSISGSFEGLGMTRKDGKAAYAQAISSTIEDCSTDKIYTFLFWGLSRFLDLNKWQVRGGGFFSGLCIDFSMCSGGPPAFVSMYQLLDSGEENADHRHLMSRRQHCFNCAFWSQVQPLESRALEQLLSRPGRPEGPPGKLAPQLEAQAGGLCLGSCCLFRGKRRQPSSKLSQNHDVGNRNAT